MYSEKLVSANLDQFALENAWMPTRHTFAEVQEFTEYINNLVKPVEENSKSTYYALTRPITEKRKQEIRRWIENEQVLCGVDYRYWRDNYAYVVNEGGQEIKFKNRRSQDVFDAVVADLEEQGAGIQVLCLKARQIGCTTLVALMFIHRMLFIPNTLAVMASVQKEKSEEIEVKLNTGYSKCPFWLVPQKAPKRSFTNGSRLSIESGMQPKGIAQGKTPNLIHICLSPETMIHTQNGAIKRIKDVIAGDSVITSRGRLMEVYGCVQSPRQDEVACEISLWGNYNPLIVTRDHPILTPDGFVAAENVEKRSFVSMPLRPIRKTVHTVEIIHKKRGSKATQDKVKSEVKETRKIDRQWGWLCGLYLAEGSVKTRATDQRIADVTFSVHQKEAGEIKIHIQEVLGMFQKVALFNSKTSKSANVSVYSGGLANWLADNFGKGAGNKTIPDWVFDAGEEFVKGLLQGYLEGDGHISSKLAQVTCHSISLGLLIQLRDLLASMGYGWSCLYNVPAGMHYGRQCQEQWFLAINGDYARKLRLDMGWKAVDKKVATLPLDDARCSSAPKHWKYSPDGRFVWIQVYENRPIPCESFYDLEVNAPEHDFCTVHCCVKNSEIGLIPNPHNVIEEGLLPATHSNKNLFMVFEGTGSGNVGWFPDFWRDTKKNWPLGLARMCPVFISWPLATDLYPQADWLRQHPVPTSFYEKRLDATRVHITRCESYIRNTPYLAKVVGSDYRVPIEQQWFWEFEYRQARERHSLHQHAARLPADDFEALTGEHDSVFDEEIIMSLEDRIWEINTNGARKRKEPVQVYAITGHSIDEEFEPQESQIDYSKEVIHLIWKSNRDERYDWELVPLLPVDEESEVETFDKLLVFSPPQKGGLYSCGVDTAHGLGHEDEDRFCASMTSVASGSGVDEQACELTSNHFSPAQAVPFLAAMATWYGQVSGNYRGVKFSIEQVEGPGDTCQNQLKIMGFSWHHTPGRLDGKKIKDENKHREGWYSNRTTVPILMDRFVEAVNGGWYEPKSKWLIEELKTLERRANEGGRDKMTHQLNKHDDRIRAAAQSYLNLHTYDDLAARSQRRYAVPSKKRDDGPKLCLSNTFSIGDWRD